MTAEPRTGPPDGDWLGSQFLRFERHGPLALLTVDRPEARNALTAYMYFGIRYAVQHVNQTPELAGLLITGVDDVFIPGGELGGASPDAWGDVPRWLGMDLTPFDAVRRSRKPIVCAVNGICQGGGMMIAMLSDVAVASERATFRAPELLRGIADTNYGQILPRQIGPARARDMLYTGRKVDAATAGRGAWSRGMVPHDDLMAESMGRARGVLSHRARSPRRGQADFHAYYGQLGPHRDGGRYREPRDHRGLHRLQGAPLPVVGPRRAPRRRAASRRGEARIVSSNDVCRA